MSTPIPYFLFILTYINYMGGWDGFPQGNSGAVHLGGHNGVERGKILSCTELRFCACITLGAALQILNKDKTTSLGCNES